MKYYTLHINDSGAIEDSEEIILNNQKTLVCKIYDNREFNALNDILHSLDDYVINDKTLRLFEESKIIPYDLTPVIVKRKEINLGLFKISKSYKYTQLKIRESNDLNCYNWINFNKSEILTLRGDNVIGELKSHKERLKYIEENFNTTSKINQIYSLKISESEKKEKIKDLKTFSWNTKRIVFNKHFDPTIDLFKIPFYSWGTYVSERFKDLLINNNIKDIGFADTKEELGKVWKQHFPIIEFE
ncbi:hypothetical protein [Saccharicrinis sp. FJH54]|uniref:hypothetical protein n=1 Tax=Saccharicrinis sp. FJH54 TaxID=3344665 RepID=UPI0035D4535A